MLGVRVVCGVRRSGDVWCKSGVWCKEIGGCLV